MTQFLRHDEAVKTSNRAPVTSLIQAIAKYRDEVRRYAEEVLAPIRKRFGDREAILLDDPYFTQVRLWTARLQGMADLLGLTEEEVSKIDREFGIIG